MEVGDSPFRVGFGANTGEMTDGFANPTNRRENPILGEEEDAATHSVLWSSRIFCRTNIECCDKWRRESVEDRFEEEPAADDALASPPANPLTAEGEPVPSASSRLRLRV
jgi:hypothetical protein